MFDVKSLSQRVAARYLRKARTTRQWDLLANLLKEMEEPLRNAVSISTHWNPKPVPEATANQLSNSAKAVLAYLKVSFENPKRQDSAKHFLTRIKNLVKMITEWTKAPTGEALAAVLQKQSTKSKDPWQKYLEYRNEVLGLVNYFDAEIEAKFAVDHFSVVLMTAARGDWDEAKIRAVRWVLQQETKILSRAGFGQFAQSKFLAYPSETVPGGTGSVLAYYNTGTHLMALAAAGDPHETLRTLTHEFGHKVYFEGLGTQGRASWKEFFDASQGTPPNLDRMIKEWEDRIAQSTKWELQNHGRYFTYYYGEIKQTDPEAAMWLAILMDKLKIKEELHPLTGGPKRGSLPGLDQLIARRSEARTFLYPITAYSASSAEELFAEVFSYYLTMGPGAIPEIVRDQFRQAVPMLKLARLSPVG